MTNTVPKQIPNISSAAVINWHQLPEFPWLQMCLLHLQLFVFDCIYKLASSIYLKSQIMGYIELYWYENKAASQSDTSK